MAETRREQRLERLECVTAFLVHGAAADVALAVRCDDLAAALRHVSLVPHSGEVDVEDLLGALFTRCLERSRSRVLQAVPGRVMTAVRHWRYIMHLMANEPNSAHTDAWLSRSETAVDHGSREVLDRFRGRWSDPLWPGGLTELVAMLVHDSPVEIHEAIAIAPMLSER
jgi:hypothetical protein